MERAPRGAHLSSKPLQLADVVRGRERVRPAGGRPVFPVHHDHARSIAAGVAGAVLIAVINTNVYIAASLAAVEFGWGNLGGLRR